MQMIVSGVWLQAMPGVSGDGILLYASPLRDERDGRFADHTRLLELTRIADRGDMIVFAQLFSFRIAHVAELFA